MTGSLASSNLPVVILGRHITATNVLRTLVRRGLKAYVAQDTTDIITRSRWYRPTPHRIAETDDSALLARFLERLPLKSAVLMACGDRWTAAVAGLPPETRARYRASVPPRDAVEICIDKERFRAFVADLGIPAPRSRRITSAADLRAVSDEELAGGFLKPTDSQRYARVFATKGAFAATRAEATELVGRAVSEGFEYLLQEWIPGGISRTILIDGFVDRHGQVAAVVARRRVRMDPPRIANTATSVTIPLAEVGEAVEITRRILAALAYRGIFNVEFKQDERDGLFKIIEVNPRPTWYIEHLARAGAHTAWMSYLDAQDLPVAPMGGYDIGRYGMYEVYEIAALLRAWSSRRRPNGPVIRPWLKGDHMLIRLDDPMPGAADLARAVRGRVANIARRLAPARLPVLPWPLRRG